MVGGSCAGSPARMTDSAPCSSGTSVAGSVTWLASSITTSLKRRSCRMRSPAPVHVAAITCVWRKSISWAVAALTKRRNEVRKRIRSVKKHEHEIAPGSA